MMMVMTFKICDDGRRNGDDGDYDDNNHDGCEDNANTDDDDG